MNETSRRVKLSLLRVRKDPSLAELEATPPGVYFEDSDPFDMHCYPETEWSKTALFCTSTALNVPPGKKPLANISSRASNAQLDPWADPTSQYPASQSKCIPHTEVERKYREKLNAEIERLRRAVPVLPQSSTADVMNLSKPSKGMVLAVAVGYIKELESQRDAAVREVERLGGEIRFEERRECSRGHRTEV
ncbi:unnamed protein product [Alternaria sp. RS040]